MPAATTTQQSNPFIKQLASSDRRIRDQALSSLRAYLHRPTPFTELEFLKLWKGLFYCMWMSDKPLTQQRLARDLADLLSVLHGKQNFLGFVDAFWMTMAREWGGIDALRMDKFLYLVRCYVGQGFECVSKGQWGDEDLLEEYLGVLEAIPLNSRDAKIPNGLRYHVSDIYVDELDKVDTRRTVPLEKMLAPLRKLAKDTPTKAVRQRVQEALEDECLEDWQTVQSDGEGVVDEDVASGGEATCTATGDDSEMDDGEDFAGFGD